MKEGKQLTMTRTEERRSTLALASEDLTEDAEERRG